MKAIDLTNVQEAGEFKRPEAGPYICKITSAEDVPDKQYIKVGYDIAAGEFEGYYTKTREDHPEWEWVGQYVKSYKPKALPMLKRFCSAISKSNGSFIFDAGTVNSDEKTLVGKKIGLIFQEEEYYGNDGEKKTRLTVYSEFPISELSKQKVPNIKKLKESTNAGSDDFMKAPEGDNSEVPFD